MNQDVKNELVAEVNDCIKAGDTEKFAAKMVSFVEETEQRLKADYEELKNEKDEAILASRNIFKLTKDEKDFYGKIIESVKNDSGVSGITYAMPESIINRIFDDLKKKHPLLDKVDVVNTKYLTKFLVNSGISGTAGWGELCAAVDDEIANGIVFREVTLNKLSAFMVVCLTAIELGEEWLDRFCRETLGEAIALALEDAIINGTGSSMPIGMIKTIADYGETQTVPAVTKDAVEVNDLGVASLAGIAKTLSNDGAREVGRMIMVVNPADYYSKVIPAIRLMNAEGKYVEYLPFPVDIVTSVKMASGKAVFGIGKNYWLGVGLGKDGKLTASDHFKFLDDVRTFKQKVVAGGQPKDNASFVYADISNLAPAYYTVRALQEEASL